MGFRERWQRSGKAKHYKFISGGITIHAGEEGTLLKPQLMRSEWVGRASNEFADDVGHPHWQIDVMETIRRRDPDGPMPDGWVTEPWTHFGREQRNGLNEQEDLLRRIPIERMHLASAAPWWQPSHVRIAHSPTNISELDRWILGCLAYLRDELERCRLT